MRIGFAGPIDVQALAGEVSHPDLLRPGYTFPFTTDLATEYLRQGHSLVVFAADESVEEPIELPGSRCVVHVTPRRPDHRVRGRDKFLAERESLAPLMASSGVDVIHAHWSYEFAWAALDSGLPTMVTVHDWAPQILRQNPDAYRLSRLRMQHHVLRRTRHVTAPSPYLASRVSRLYRHPVLIVPNGLPDAWWRWNRRAGVSDTAVVGCLNIGYDRRKNMRTMIEAAKLVRDQRSDVVFRFAGPGYQAGAEAHAHARKIGIADAIEWCGPLPPDGVREYLDSLSLFVHPSREESFGMALLEAGAVGVPVLGGDKAGAVPWVIGIANTVNIKKPGLLADAILRKLAEPHSAEQLAAATKTELESRFHIQTVASSYLRELARVAS